MGNLLMKPVDLRSKFSTEGRRTLEGLTMRLSWQFIHILRFNLNSLTRWHLLRKIWARYPLWGGLSPMSRRCRNRLCPNWLKTVRHFDSMFWDFEFSQEWKCDEKMYESILSFNFDVLVDKNSNLRLNLTVIGCNCQI